MKLETGKKLYRGDEAIIGGDGEAVVLGSYLALLVERGPGIESKDAIRCMRLGDKLQSVNGSAEINDDEEKLLRNCLDNTPGINAWFRAYLNYLLWPGELSDGDREMMARRFSEGE